jgi:hypothetical protein
MSISVIQIWLTQNTNGINVPMNSHNDNSSSFSPLVLQGFLYHPISNKFLAVLPNKTKLQGSIAAVATNQEMAACQH